MNQLFSSKRVQISIIWGHISLDLIEIIWVTRRRCVWQACMCVQLLPDPSYKQGTIHSIKIYFVYPFFFFLPQKENLEGCNYWGWLILIYFVKKFIFFQIHLVFKSPNHVTWFHEFLWFCLNLMQMLVLNLSEGQNPTHVLDGHNVVNLET
jgi:hypothetical protein